jgi:hypothetical protein
VESKKKQCYTKYIPKNDLQDSLRLSAVDFINSFSKNIYDSNDILRVNVADGFGYINFIAKTQEWPDIIRKIFLQCYFIAEQKVAGSGIFATYFLAKRLTNCVIKDHKGTNVYRSNLHNMFKSLESLIDQGIYDVIEQTVKLCGINGDILIRSSPSRIPAIELTSGHKFQIGLSGLYILNSEIRSESRIILFDGAIIDIGQVDRLFTSACEKKITCIIVARSFGDDVISTINANQSRDTLDIIPVVVDDKLENINIINDLAICANVDVITAESGIRLSNIDIEDIPTISGIKITKTKFEFKSKPHAANAVSKRIRIIKDRIQRATWDDEMTAEDVEKVFATRLHSLSGNLANLWVPGNKKFLSYVRTRFNFAIQYITAWANSGCIMSSEILITSDLPEFMPANVADISLIVSNNVYNSVTTAGGCIAIQ